MTTPTIESLQALPPLDLGRTAEAIQAFDDHWITFDRCPQTNEAIRAWVAESERMGAAAGHAFGLDTADRNNLKTCEDCVRPGPPGPPRPGFAENFVRRAVREWRARKRAEREAKGRGTWRLVKGKVSSDCFCSAARDETTARTCEGPWWCHNVGLSFFYYCEAHADARKGKEQSCGKS